MIHAIGHHAYAEHNPDLHVPGHRLIDDRPGDRVADERYPGDVYDVVEYPHPAKVIRAPRA
jgi:hypothetical protein